MKVKRLLLCILLSLALVVTFIPVFSFANDDSDDTSISHTIFISENDDWLDVSVEEDEGNTYYFVQLAHGTLFCPDVDLSDDDPLLCGYEGETTYLYPYLDEYYYVDAIKCEAYDADTDEYIDDVELNELYDDEDGMNYYSFVMPSFEDHPDYYIVVSIDTAYDSESSWEVIENEDDIEIPYGGKATLSVRTDYDGEEDVFYQWYYCDGWDENDEPIWKMIDGAENNTYVTGEEGGYICKVTIGEVTKPSVWIDVYYDTSGYKHQVEYPNATAVYKADRPLVIDYNDEDNSNFPQSGDIITVTNGNKTFDYVSSDEDNWVFVYTDEDGNEDYLDLSWDLDWDVDVKAGKVYANVSSYYDYDHQNKIEYVKYDIDMIINATVKTDISSMAFGTNNISVYSEDIKEVRNNTTYYPLYNRCKYKEGDSSWNDYYANGETLTIAYKDGRTVKYTYDSYYRDFIYINPATGNREDSVYLEPKDENLKPGNNTVQFWYHGVSATMNVYMDTPQLRTQRQAAAAAAAAAAREKAAEAARQGTFNKSMPAVKAAKPKAAKKSITVKWKKLKKKQFKSGVSKIEVWVCTNKAFARGATIEKTVGKKKASVKIKGLKKGTYYVKVRSIKNVNGQKIVGKWSAVKKVKVKK